jgi:hypothetical protein
MKKNILLTLISLTFFTVHNPLFSQGIGTEKKLNTLITAIEDTKFIKAYKELKNKVENTAAEVKLAQADPKDVARVKLAYNQSKFRFDGVLDQLKRDLANSDTRKMILKSPETFSRNYQKRLDEAETYCNDNFNKKAAAILKTDAAGLDNIELLVGTFFTIFKAFTEKKAAKDEYSIQFLELNLIDPLRLKAWDKIEN